MFTSFIIHKAKMDVKPSADIKVSLLILQMLQTSSSHDTLLLYFICQTDTTFFFNFKSHGSYFTVTQ